MIKSVVDLTLRLTDLLEAEGRVAKTHVIRILSGGLLLALGASLTAVGLVVAAAAALLALVETGLSWPMALLIVAGAALGLAAGLAFAGWRVLQRSEAAGRRAVPSDRHEPLPVPPAHVVRTPSMAGGNLS